MVELMPASDHSERYARREHGSRRVPILPRDVRARRGPRVPRLRMKLVAFEKLPPSLETHDEFGLPRDPLHEPLPWTYARAQSRRARGDRRSSGWRSSSCRGSTRRFPRTIHFSGFLLARRIGWVWGAGVGWLVLVPTVLSRRTIAQMRGARVAAAFLSATSLVSCAILLFVPAAQPALQTAFRRSSPRSGSRRSRRRSRSCVSAVARRARRRTSP